MADGRAGEPGPVAAWYLAQVAAGALRPDSAQVDLVATLDRLVANLTQPLAAAKRRPLGRLFGQRDRLPTKGLYIFGGVGTGKTMLMDAFFAAVPVPAKRRTHFHGFMTDVHDRIHATRQAMPGGGDPIAPVAQEIAAESNLLCLDEFAVEDIADAMILARLFRALFDNDLVLVATSNVAPADLYRDGLNRALFLPFVDVLEAHVDVLELVVGQDYRLQRLGEQDAYMVPADARAREALDGVWRSLTGGAVGRSRELPLRGRSVFVPRAAGSVARFEFADLCEAPLGTSDFAAIASAFDTVLIDDIPTISDGRRDLARRFINLVDVFYDAGVKTFVSAAAEPEDLYRAREGAEAAAFARTRSRLTEMRSSAYVTARRQARDASATTADGAEHDR